MAEGFFNFYNKSPEYIGMSAGINPSKEIKPEAIEVMNEKGIDISKQRPTLLDWNIAQKAYKIFTMGCIKGCPVTPKDITFEWNFDDPAGKPIEKYSIEELEIRLKKR